MMRLSTVGFLVATTLLTTASIEAARAQETATVLIYYRLPFDTLGGFGFTKAPVFIDSKEIVKLKKDTFVRLAVSPGKHHFRSERMDVSFTLDLEGGRTYDLSVALRYTVMSASKRLTAVCEETGSTEGAYARLEEVRDIEEATSVHLAEVPPAVPEPGAGDGTLTVSGRPPKWLHS
ncbi:MAG: hypothetical protein HYV63_26970 [Candidatus Schekmanbacteria bacterium]|nr:hypothetical protein [Candidatus Schekmanbacteria bacterium]